MIPYEHFQQEESDSQAARQWEFICSLHMQHLHPPHAITECMKMEILGSTELGKNGAWKFPKDKSAGNVGGHDRTTWKEDCEGSVKAGICGV